MGVFVGRMVFLYFRRSNSEKSAVGEFVAVSCGPLRGAHVDDCAS